MGQALAAQGYKTDVSAGLAAAMSALKQ
jgi:hypothetical protein